MFRVEAFGHSFIMFARQVEAFGAYFVHGSS
jgi:hypothetical protein